MSELKKGDIVEISSKNTTYTLRATTGCRYVVNKIVGNIVKVDCVLSLDKQDIKKIGESKMKYEESNRYKLAQAVKKTGLKVSVLSASASNNANISYFTNYQAKSRFNERGDISEVRLNELLTDLAFAEREVLGIGAKTVDEPNKETVNAINSECEDDVYLTAKDLVESINDGEDLKKPSAKRPLVLFLIMVILASFYFLNLFFGWV